MYRLGVDVGSTFTKYCIMDDQNNIVKLYTEKTPTRQKDYFRQALDAINQDYPIKEVVSCGYGRHNISGLKTMSELSALAVGAWNQYSEENVILDIGGQDTKIIRQEDGKLTKFFLNDRCAAGCGIFLSNTLNLLGYNYSDINLNTPIHEPQIQLSSVCAVFAQSEITEHIAANISDSAIIRAVIDHVLAQAKMLLRKIDCESLILSGGFSRISGIDRIAAEVFHKKVIIPKNAAYLSAIGCAISSKRTI